MSKRKVKVYLIVNANNDIDDSIVIDSYDPSTIDRIINDSKKDSVYIKINDKKQIDEIIMYAKNKGFQVVNYGKTYILNKCFTGTKYALFGANISHEAINKFVADDGYRYFFLCDNGKIDKSKIGEELFIGNKASGGKIFSLKNAELISFSEYEAGQKKKYAFIQKVEELTIPETEEKKITYNNVCIKDIFKENGYSKSSKISGITNSSTEDQFPCVTFKGENVFEPTGNLEDSLFTYDDLRVDDAEQLSRSSMRQYVFEGTKLYKKIEERLKKFGWSKETPKDFDSSYHEEDSVLGVLGKLERETYWSSLIAYTFQHSPEILKQFLGESIDDYQVYNEEKNVDILIRSAKKIVIIENKIAAGINEGEKEDWESFINPKEFKREIVDCINKQFPAKDKTNNQLQKYYKLAQYYAAYQGLSKESVKCYILCPEYKKDFYSVEKDKYTCGKEYEVKTYKELNSAISNGKRAISAIDKKGIVDDIQRAIKIYTYKHNEYYIEQICGRFINKIKTEKGKNK